MWRRAMEEENENLQNTQTWELVTKPEGIKFIISKWLFPTEMDFDVHQMDVTAVHLNGTLEEDIYIPDSNFSLQQACHKFV
ncbi:hypothetical protein AVEN_460-1, partial [Araneus ventricosus]